MNFRHMPELDWRLGYPFAIGTMALAAFVLYRVFRRREWL
jgi:magnesium transporter